MAYIAKLKRTVFFAVLGTLALVNSGCSLFVGENVDDVTQAEVDANRELSICGTRTVAETCKTLYCCLTACVTEESAQKFQAKLIEQWKKHFPDTSGPMESRHKFSTDFSPASKCQKEVILTFTLEGGSRRQKERLQELKNRGELIDPLKVPLRALHSNRNKSDRGNQKIRDDLTTFFKEAITSIESDVRVRHIGDPLLVNIKMPGSCKRWQASSSAAVATSAVQTPTVFTNTPVQGGQGQPTGFTQYEGQPTSGADEEEQPGEFDVETTQTNNTTCVPTECNCSPKEPVEVELDWDGIFPKR